MKKIFSKAALLIVAMLSSMFLVSCGDDETPEAPKAKVETITPNYSVYLSDDYLAVYDAKVTYGYGDTEVMTETISTNEWSYKNAIKASSISMPTNFFCKVVLTQKQDAEIDVTKKYVLSYHYSASVTGIRTDKSEVSFGSLTNKAYLPLRDSKIKEYFDRKKVINIFEFNCEVK